MDDFPLVGPFVREVPGWAGGHERPKCRRDSTPAVVFGDISPRGGDRRTAYRCPSLALSIAMPSRACLASAAAGALGLTVPGVGVTCIRHN